MPKFKYKPEDFVIDNSKSFEQQARAIAARANELLEAELGKCRKVYGFQSAQHKGEYTMWCAQPNERRVEGGSQDSHTALLFNVEPIGEGEK